MTEEAVIETKEAVELSDEQKRARRRVYAQAAISLAMQARWEDALSKNQDILDIFPDDPEAHNRSGNAYVQLNRVSDAIEAYEKALSSQPTNAIAQRNLTRLKALAETGDAAASSQKLPPSFFVEDVGKTGITTLVDVNPEAAVRAAAGEEITLRAVRNAIEASLSDKTKLGKIEPGLAERLIRLMKTGNKYQAGVTMAEPGRLRILVREIAQSPENEGRISFPPKTVAVRAYTRDSLLRRSGDEDDELEEAAEVDGEEVDEEDENPSEFGFSETSGAGDSDRVTR